MDIQRAPLDCVTCKLDMLVCIFLDCLACLHDFFCILIRIQTPVSIALVFNRSQHSAKAEKEDDQVCIDCEGAELLSQSCSFSFLPILV